MYALKIGEVIAFVMVSYILAIKRKSGYLKLLYK